MTLADVLAEVALRSELPPPLRTTPISGLEYDSRRVQSGSLFWAFPGAKSDGRQFAKQAIERGAVAVVSETPAPEGFEGPWIEVEHGRRALAIAGRNFYGDPSSRIMLTGVTGTNGKTTTSLLIDSILRAAGWTTGLIGTIAYHIAGRELPAVNTTPESLDVLRLLVDLEKAGGKALTMEVSSHALALGRAYALRFHTVVFTNLTRDHLDFHHTMEEYFEAKALLFSSNNAAPPPACSVVNIDDEYGARLSRGAEHYTYGTRAEARLQARNIQTGFDGVRFDAAIDGKLFPIRSPLLATINVYNILAAIGAGLSYGLDMETIGRGIEACTAVPGRFERVDAGQPFLVVVDYAHTDDALRNAIQAGRALHPNRIITVFGCGGDRDRSKRPLMGKAAAELSDLVVLTSDNPRSEDPLAIMNDALVGICRYDTPYKVEPDRKSAIHLAIEEAKPGDLVLIAGKGHEAYQILKDRTIDFDDRQVARGAIEAMR